jgi:phage FluMu gp28-like protein
MDSKETYFAEQEDMWVKWELAMRDPWIFLTHFVYTLDPHAPAGNAVRKFPPKNHLLWLTRRWEEENRLLVAKSRQLQVSWLFVALYTWDSMAHFGKYTIFQSKTEKDAGFTSVLSLASRAYWIWDHLPEEIKNRNPVNRGKKPPILFFERTQSTIHGISQNPKSSRQYTATGFLSDEMAFQQDPEQVIIAAMPALDISGKFTGVSSANGKEFFYRLLYDKVGI